MSPSRIRPGGGSACSGFGSALVLVLARPGVRLKTVAPFVFCSGYELPVTTRFLVGGRFVLSRHFVGEFMRLFIATAALCAAFAGQPAFAEDAESQPSPQPAAFDESGVYIAPGEGAEVTIAGDCRLLTNQDEKFGFYITPALHDAWPDAQDRAPLEPVVTEEPCK